MKRKWILIVSLALLASFMLTGSALGKAYRGVAPYDGRPEFGMVKWLDNPAGFHFWFTMEADLIILPWYNYEEGHSYHNIYKLEVDDPSEWCGIGMVTVPNKSPFNQTRHVGEQVYFKIWDITDNEWDCP